MGRPLRIAASLSAFLLWGMVSAASAQPEPEDVRDGDLELPRRPDELPAALSIEVHLAAVASVASSALCPRGADCIFGSGGGVGGSLERRWPSGLALGLAYDAWFVESGGVWELGVLHVLSARIRWALLQSRSVHPFAWLGVGALVFGDTLRIATVGAAGDVAVGLEVEVTETIALSFALPFRVFTTAPFVTVRDRVPRADQAGVNVGFAIQAGLVIVATP